MQEKTDVQVTETRKRVLGDEHPSTLNTMANLAFVASRPRYGFYSQARMVQLILSS
jgi:hypothetical protein